MQRPLYDIRMEYLYNSYHRWVSKELFSFQWFFIVAVLAILYIVWVKLVDKQRLKDLLLFGSFISVVAAVVDIVGVSTGLWEYKVRLFPISPAVFPFDYTLVPIFYMFVLQYTSSWKSYLIGSSIAAAINCFVINPIYVMVGILHYIKFNYFYLFVLIFVLTTIIKAIFDWVDNIVHKNSFEKAK